MALDIKLSQKLMPQLVMTPQLQQAIKLLQLSHTELEELIEQTLVENPVLEEGMDIDSFPNRETPAAEENPETPEVASGTEDFESAREVEKEDDQGQKKLDSQRVGPNGHVQRRAASPAKTKLRDLTQGLANRGAPPTRVAGRERLGSRHSRETVFSVVFPPDQDLGRAVHRRTGPRIRPAPRLGRRFESAPSPTTPCRTCRSGEISRLAP